MSNDKVPCWGTDAVWDGNAIHSTHFVNGSTITKTLVLSEVDSGNGPKKSRWTRSIGTPAWYLVIGHLAFLFAFLDLLHLAHDRPSANGQVERFNRTLMDAVRCFVDKSQDNWDEHLSQLARSIRSSVNWSTGFTPNKLMLGREVNLPADLVFRPPDAVNGEDHEDYVNRLQGAIRVSPWSVKMLNG
jgi:hypothetical protein